jgi:hypothetical protein
MATNVSDTALWFGLPLSFWDSAASKLLWLAVGAGVLAAVASGLSSLISSAVTAQVQDLAGVRISAAELELQKSRERTAALTASVAEANARAAEANKIAEQERLARRRIEAGLASRRLSPEQASRFVASLTPFRGVMPAVSVTVLGDAEAKGFAEDLARAIDRAGIPVHLDLTGVMVPPPYGLIVTDTPTSAIRGALNTAGIPAQYRLETAETPRIVVGLKPPPV